MIAALTLAVLMPNIQEKIRIHKDTNVKYKLTEATDKMKSLGILNDYKTTEEFVDELQKHLKILKRCNSESLSNCWPTAVVYDADGEEYQISELTKGKNLGFSKRTTNNVGLILADGSSLILSYDKDCPMTYDEAATYPWTKDFYGAPVTNATTSCISALFDINGSGKPNKETEDIRSLNGAKIFRDCLKIASGLCVSMEDTAPILISMNDPDYMNYINKVGGQPCKWQGNLCGGYDYQLGSALACDNIGKRLPTEAEMYTLASYIYNDPRCAGKSYDWGSGCFSKLNGTINNKINMAIGQSYMIGKWGETSQYKGMSYNTNGTSTFTAGRNGLSTSFYSKVRCVDK